MCTVTFAFFLIYTHFLNFTGGLQDAMFSMGVCICVLYVCMRKEREKEKKNRKSKKEKEI